MKPSERIEQIKDELIDAKASAGAARVTPAFRERIAREMNGPKLDFAALVQYLDERHDQAQKGKTSK